MGYTEINTSVFPKGSPVNSCYFGKLCPVSCVCLRCSTGRCKLLRRTMSVQCLWSSLTSCLSVVPRKQRSSRVTNSFYKHNHQSAHSTNTTISQLILQTQPLVSSFYKHNHQSAHSTNTTISQLILQTQPSVGSFYKHNHQSAHSTNTTISQLIL